MKSNLKSNLVGGQHFGEKYFPVWQDRHIRLSLILTVNVTLDNKRVFILNENRLIKHLKFGGDFIIAKSSWIVRKNGCKMYVYNLVTVYMPQ